MLGIGSLVSGALSIAKSLCSVITRFPNPGGITNTIKLFCNIAVGVLKALGILKPDNKVEDLTDKAVAAEKEGITPDKFDSYSEYLKKVEEYELDPEKAKLITDNERLQKSVEIATGILLEQFNDMPIEDFLEYACKNPDYFTPERMAQIGDLIVKNGEYIEDILKYLNGTEKNDMKMEHVIDVLIDIEKTIDPTISDTDALKYILNQRK